MIPVNAIASAAVTQQNVADRKDNTAYERAASTTVVETESEVNRKRTERAKVVTKSEKAQEKQRSEENLTREDKRAEDQDPGHLADIYA